MYCTVLYCTALCRYAEDWGEQMVAKVNPVIVRLSLASEQPVEASVVPGDSCPGVRSDGTIVPPC